MVSRSPPRYASIGRGCRRRMAGRMMSAYIVPTIVGNGKNLSRRRRYLDGGGIRNDFCTGTKVCVCVWVFVCAYSCACVCVWSAILTTLTAGARLLYIARAFPLSQTGHPAVGTGDLTSWSGIVERRGIEHRSSIVWIRRAKS